MEPPEKSTKKDGGGKSKISPEKEDEHHIYTVYPARLNEENTTK